MYDGDLEIPILNGTFEMPDELVLFSRVKNKRINNKWICFYEDDSKIESFWNSPRKYLAIMKRAKGVILPDFSVFRDMPLVQQNWNIYRIRALGTWLESHGKILHDNLVKSVLNKKPVKVENTSYGIKNTYKIKLVGKNNKEISAMLFVFFKKIQRKQIIGL